MSIKNNQRGFTIIELMVVVIMICILSALVITTSTGIQQKNRDKERQEDITTIYNQLESYYIKNSVYPTLAQINDSSWRSTNMKDLNVASLQDPKGKSPNLASSPSSATYSYAVRASDGRPCDNTATDCTSYTLTATLESANPFVKTNLAN